MNERTHEISLFNGEVVLYIEQETINMLVCDSHGEPAELAIHEADMVIEELQELVDELTVIP